MANGKPSMILILGVTASGKGRVAFELARELGAEIVSADSMKVYRPGLQRGLRWLAPGY